MNVVEIVQDFGLPVALVLFFIWQSKIREDRMTARLDALEDYQRNTMEKIIRQCTSVMLRLESYLQKDKA